MSILRFLTPLVFLLLSHFCAAGEPGRKVLIMGNSITLHAPAPNIGWTGNWGMAASTEDKDYVHLLLADLEKSWGERPRSKVKNIADFERGHGAFDVAAKLRDELAFGADVVILAIGENAAELTTAEAKEAFSQALVKLLKAFKSHGNPAIFVRSCFWPNAAKDEILSKACNEVGGTFVDISTLGKDPAMKASAERKIEHTGVAGHPGDKGMRAIADAIFGSIQKHLPVRDQKK